MTEQIARRSIDYLNNHSSHKDQVSITFYGGEPLLEFELLKNIVIYARESLKNKELNYSITTNGTIIDYEIADYLYKEKFGVLVSIDGPKEIHDSWRKDAKSDGSFERTYRGLNILSEVYKKDLSKIGLSMVYAPPYSEEKVEETAKFISSINWMAHDIRINITYPQRGSTAHIYGDSNNDRNIDVIDYSLSNWAKKRFLSDYTNKQKSHPISNAILEKNIARLLQRSLIDKPTRKAHLNGCCVPGARKLFITSTGDMKICERIGKAPDIGDVNNGISLEIIKKNYIDEYSEKSIVKCSKCWLARLCSICYQQAFYNNEVDIAKKEEYCLIQKVAEKESLKYYCILMEIDEKGLDYLYEWKFK
jgi:uncharacterized protein